MQKQSFVLVGPGAVGRVLARRLVRAGWHLEIVIGSGSSAGRRFARSLKVRYSTQLTDITLQSGILLLAVQSNRVEAVARDLSRQKLPWKNLTAIHVSGPLGLEPLSSLKAKGSAVAAAHPYMTFLRIKPAEKQEPHESIVYGIDGDQRGLIVARRMVKALGGTAIIVRGKDRIAYHGSAVIACALLAADIKMALTVLKKLKISDAVAKKAVLSIAKETIRNISEYGVERALTGPAARGDKKTVKLQQSALKKLDPAIAKLYGELSEWVMKEKSKRNRSRGKNDY